MAHLIAKTWSILDRFAQKKKTMRLKVGKMTLLSRYTHLQANQRALGSTLHLHIQKGGSPPITSTHEVCSHCHNLVNF